MGLFFKRHKVTGVFRCSDDLIPAVRSVVQSRFAIDRIYSPVPAEDIYELAGMGRSPLRFFTFFGGMLGGIMAIVIAVYSALQWRFIIQNKPVIGWPSFILVAYEYTLIWAALFTFLGVLVLGRMPSKIFKDHDARFTGDDFGLRIKCRGADRRTVADLLSRHGAIDVYEETF